MAAPECSLSSSFIDDPTDPALLTREQLVGEVAALMALGLRRWFALRVSDVASNDSLAPADSSTISPHST